MNNPPPEVHADEIGSPGVKKSRTTWSSFQIALIRAIDLIGAGVGLVVAWPVILGLIIAVRATSPGPGLFAQPRLGRGERPFTCYKIRTMSVGTASAGTHEVSAAAVTPLGRGLRRLKLDELPQLWNVLVGEMSLVGPRPGLLNQYELREARRTRGIFNVRPGVTGPGQVAGVDMSEPVRLAALDATFADEPTVAAYFKYILLTVMGHGQGDRIRES